MTLGEHIRTLRIQHKLSQEDLAARLDVSRQSVSKWETDASVPDLDKLVKLSDLFSVSLDQLVRGDTAKPETAYFPSPTVGPRPLRQYIGGALLGLAGLLLLVCILLAGHLGTALLLALPFAVCGVICLTVSWHPGLICAWSLSALADLFVVDGLRCNWRTGLRSLRYLPQNWPLADWQWFDLAMTALQIAWIVFLMVWLGKCLLPHIPPLDRKKTGSAGRRVAAVCPAPRILAVDGCRGRPAPDPPALPHRLAPLCPAGLAAGLHRRR